MVSDLGGYRSRFAQWLVVRLARWVRQPWSTAFVEAVYGIVPGTAVELVIRRWGRDGEQEVLLFRRTYSRDDPWNQLWHCAGTMVRVTDGQTAARLTAERGQRVWSHDVALNRLINGEVCAWVQFICMVGRDEIPDFGPRGLVWQIIYTGTLPEGTPAPPGAQWFPVRALPGDIIPEHVAMIERALAPAHR